MRVLFVCSGNTCRSALAEVIARKLTADRGLDGIEFVSAGTGALDGGGASEGAILVAMERGLDLASHRTSALTPSHVARADLVLVMSPSHYDAATAFGGEGKTYLLDDFASGGATSAPIDDPFGGELSGYRETATELEKRISLALDRIAASA